MKYPLLTPLLVVFSALPLITAASISPPANATLFTCPSALSTPTQLESFSGGNLLISPTLQVGELCILSRVNRISTSKRTFIPVARSYDGNDWHRVEGRYVSHVIAQCGNTSVGGSGYAANDYLCLINVPSLVDGNVGYFLSRWEEGEVSQRRVAARFLEKATWGARWNEIRTLEDQLISHGPKALGLWVKHQQSLPPTSHRAYFRERLSPRTVESYIYGIPGPKACEKNARFRRFAFTYKDVELSRGSAGYWGGSNGLPYTTVGIETVSADGVEYYAVKFGGQFRTILSSPLMYKHQTSGLNVSLADGKYTLCHVEEVVGNKVGNVTYDNVGFQLLVGDPCTSSYTSRGGVQDGKGDGAFDKENIRTGGILTRTFDRNACEAKCIDKTKVQYIFGGNPEVQVPDAFDASSLSWIDLTNLNINEIVNINAERTHDSSWLLQKDLETCADNNGEAFPHPARLAYTDFNSYGHGKFSLDKPIFAKLPGNKWALHDFRTQFKGNTPDDPLEDGGGGAMKAASRSGANEDGNPSTDLVTRCSNVQRNVFNEQFCRISYHESACVSVPLADASTNWKSVLYDPSTSVDKVSRYLPSYAGPDNGGVVVCGSENEVAPIPTEDDHFDVTNRKVQPGSIDYHAQKATVWTEVVLKASDQLCQRLAFGLSKIFATSTDTNPDSVNTETNIGVYDNFVTSCHSTYRDVMKKVSFNQEMSEQLTYQNSKSVASDWHNLGKLAWPDENYARENLQLHSIGLLKLKDDGTPVLDRFGKRMANYEQKHIFTAAKIWTSFKESVRRGNYEDLDWATKSYLDPLQINDVFERDWFPKISMNGGYIGDKYPLCSDFPERHFLRKGATFRLLGGSAIPLSHSGDPLSWEGDEEVNRMSLHPGSGLYKKLCNPTVTPLPPSLLTPGTGLAAYNATLKAPLCLGRSSSCDSGDFLAGRASEVNSPNTIDGCSGGSDKTATYKESVKRIVVSSLIGDDLRGGNIVNIQATTISFSKYDRVDFYYASNASSPKWILITIVAPLTNETNVTTPYIPFPNISYTLPKCLSASGCQQAVRVVLRSSRISPTSSTYRNDGQHKPTSNCSVKSFDDVDDLVFEVLPSPRPRDMCTFKTLVSLNENLQCEGRECVVSVVRVVEVVPGVFYEYLHLPCVHFPFYRDAVKVFSGYNNDLYMCADKQLASGISTCCGDYSNRDLRTPQWADVLSEYRGERLTYSRNAARCEDWGRTICDPQRIGDFTMVAGHCLHHQSCRDVRFNSANIVNSAWHWTTAGCKIRVKVDSNGLIAILHEPENKWKSSYANSQNYPSVQSHVNENKTVSFFFVQWNSSNVGVGKLEYPHPTDNTCDGGSINGDFCICDSNVTTSAVFNSLPTRDALISDLYVGAFDPTTMFEASEYVAILESEEENGVSVYRKLGFDEYSEHTIFRTKSEYSNDYIFLKNVHSVVQVCDGAFFFRNSPTFYDVVDPQLLSAYHETDAYLDYVDRHSSTPPFVCKSLSKHFGHSNPSPQHVLGCSIAYKSGVFTWSNPGNSSDTISFGSGKRGDLKAVSASIILSGDALSTTLDSDPASGGIKEPLHKLIQIMRSMEFTRSLSHRRLDELLQSVQTFFGQAPYGTPDQFSFFPPEFSPAGVHVESSLVSPESALLNMRFIVASQNAIYAFIQNGLNSCNSGIGPFWSKGISGACGNLNDAVGYLKFVPEGNTSSSQDVVSQLSTLLTADRVSAASREIIESVYSTIYKSKGEAKALQAAQILLVSTPEFHTTNRAVPMREERKAKPPPAKNNNEPYKAIIHINLFGGMDSMNLLVPHPDDCLSLYNEYKTRRGNDLYLNETTDLIKINAASSDQPCASFGINKRLGQGFVDMYNAGEMIFFANIGHLQKPVTAANFVTETKTQLFSHFTMKEESFQVDAFNQRGNSGILGRMTDILENSMATSRVSIDANSDNLIGDPYIGLKVDVLRSRGWDRFYTNDEFQVKKTIHELNNMTSELSSINADLWSQSLIDSKEKTEKYASLLSQQHISNSNPIVSNELGDQLQIILKLIKLREERGVNRDTFAVNLGGFDTHFDLKTVLHGKFDFIGVALKSFRDNLVSLGLWEGITIVISSEFGRTVTPNTSAGTDHGWGGHHIVLGGQLRGGRILGQHPDTYDPKWTYNTGRGAWIPTTPNEAMWFGIAQWFGLKTDIALNYVLPNLNNFGCRLYSETDLYEGGTEIIPGCGGDLLEFSQVFYLTEPRLLNPDEQKSFCMKVLDAITSTITVKCVILDQIIADRSPNTSLRSLTDLAYTLEIKYEISSDAVGVSGLIADVVNSESFQEQAASVIQMEVQIESAELKISPVPSMSPSTTLNPSTPPSRLPSAGPSTSPSIFLHPSKSPSTQPSSISSNVPSETNTPSSSLGSSLSSQPSERPSVIAYPSSSPVNIPSTSSKPSVQPSISWNPSTSPYSRPSFDPSTRPSGQPSDVLPSLSQQSERPSSRPSLDPRPGISSSSAKNFELQYRGEFTLRGIDCSKSTSDITVAAKDVAKSTISKLCKGVPGLNCKTGDRVHVDKICGQEINIEIEHSRTDRLRSLGGSDQDVVEFTIILNAVANSDLRQKDSLLSQYLQGVSLSNILGSILSEITSTSSAKSIQSITAMYFKFINSFIQGLGLYYPDWGQKETCLNDGKQMDYMNTNPGFWMTERLEDCCKRYYSWDTIGCLAANAQATMVSSSGAGPTFVDPTADLYYPDWGKTETCINDGHAPSHMKQQPGVWMRVTLNECCKTYYSWDYNDCMGSGGGWVPTQAPHDAWYVHWETFTCVKSCEGPSPCGGVGEEWSILQSSKESCCWEHLWWLGDSCL